MSSSAPLRCTCGSVRGEVRDVSPSAGNHLVCMCDDCQAYAHWLGRADELLDDNGGTAVFQLTPAQLELREGTEHLRCMRLSPKGLMRWYAGCCNTPLANTLPSPRVPFAGVVCVSLQPPGEPHQTLGPVRARINARFGHGSLPPGSHARAPLSLIARSLRQLASGLLRGAHRPSPFFDADTGAPAAEPTVISKDERQRLLAQVAGVNP